MYEEKEKSIGQIETELDNNLKEYLAVAEEFKKIIDRIAAEYSAEKGSDPLMRQSFYSLEYKRLHELKKSFKLEDYNDPKKKDQHIADAKEIELISGRIPWARSQEYILNSQDFKDWEKLEELMQLMEQIVLKENRISDLRFSRSLLIDALPLVKRPVHINQAIVEATKIGRNETIATKDRLFDVSFLLRFL